MQRHASSALNNLRILEAKLKEHGQQLTAEIVRQVCARKGKIPKEYQQLDLKRKDPAATDVDEEEELQPLGSPAKSSQVATYST